MWPSDGWGQLTGAGWRAVTGYVRAASARRVALVLIALLATAAAFGWWRREPKGDAIVVQRGDLVLTAEVEGELEAVRSIELGPPPTGSVRVGDFKLTFLAAESARVKKGQPVLGFDTQPLTKQLDDRRAELAEATKRIEQRQSELRVRLLDLEQQLAQASADLDKARLKADVPADLVSRIDAQKATLEVQARERFTAGLRAETDAARSGAAIELRTLEGQRLRAQNRVEAIEALIKSMTVVAPQDGLVTYKADWNDQKKKVGDSVWMMERVIGLPDLSEMKAVGSVDEAEAGTVSAGQKVTLRLESRPDLDLSGHVQAVSRSVRRKSWRVPSKVYRIDIKLVRTDESFMRPAMRFRGEIETGRIPGLILVPRDVVHLRSRGPVVWVHTGLRYEERPVVLGRSNRRLIEVLSGVRAGDRVSAVDPALSAGPGASGPRAGGA
jgi:hypothetical protein